MSGKYLITGVAGTGKTAVTDELARRGWRAYSTDEMPEVTQLEDLRTGEFMVKDGRPIDFKKYGWNWQEAGLTKLLARAEKVFIGASVSNLHDFCHLFESIFVLSLDEATLKDRLSSRDKDDDYGKHPDDLARIFQVMETEKRRLVAHDHAILLDASQPLGRLVDELLARVGLSDASV